MRYRLLASYQGAPYEAGVGPAETGVVLFAACPPPEALGFEPATGHWRKQVDRIDVQTLYESRPVGMFRGERCVVLDELTDRLHIAYLGHDAYRAEQLGYWEVDRGVFELITPRQEVTEIVEQRLAVAALGDSTPYPAPAPMPAGFSYDAEQANGSRPHLPPSDLLAGPAQLGSDHAPLDDYLQEFPQYGGSGGRRPDDRRPDDRRPSDLGQPRADAPPLPLEAEAMRAASAAARKAKRSQPAPSDSETADATVSDLPVAGISSAAMTTGATAPSPTAPAPIAPVSTAPVSTAPAGLSEPSSAPPARGGGASAMPSWTPQPVAPQSAAAQPVAPRPAAAQPVAPQPAAAQPAAPQPATEQPATPQPAVLPAVAPMSAPPAAMPAGPLPVFDDAAIHGVPLPAPAGAPRSVPPPAGQFSAAPVPGQLSQLAPGMPSLTSQPGVNLQRGASAPTSSAAAADQSAADGLPAGPDPANAPVGDASRRTQPSTAAPAGPQQAAGPATASDVAGAGPADSGIQAGPDGPVPGQRAQAGGAGIPVHGKSPLYGPPPYAALDSQGSGNQFNGSYHGGQAHPSGPPAGSGLPRDQFERPLSGMTGGTSAADSQVANGPVLAGQMPANPGLINPAPTTGPLGRGPGQPGAAGPGEAVNGFAAPIAQAYAPAPSAAVFPPATAGGNAAAGVAVAEPILTAPYAPAAPEVTPVVRASATGSRSDAAETAEAQPASRRRRASRRRQPTQRIFSELAEQAGIPQGTYAINEDVDGAMCLVRTSEGFEVFNSLAGARHEVRIFQDEESAYFYLFGVLAADAVRTGVLGPTR